MYLISWNVAGWSSTSQAIRESYGSLHDFFECTGADIICLQECKGTLAKLTASPVEMGASDVPPQRRPSVRPLSRLSALSQTDARRATPLSGGGSGGANDGIEGWESFWSLSGKQHRGFNGVVTFARKGLTWRCDSQPFTEEEFNEEGRVVVTHHSAFVLVNVYVPNARGGARHSYKFSFLRALDSLMEKLRRETKNAVILVGDLNMTYRAMDGAWSLRRIHIGTLLQLEAKAVELSDTAWAASVPHLAKPALQRVINLVAGYLCGRVMEAAQTLTGGGGPSSPASPTPSSLSPLSPLQAPTTGVVSVDAEVAVDGEVMDRAALLQLHAHLLREGFSPSGSGGGGSRTTQMYEAPPVSLRALYKAGFQNAYASELTKGFPCAHNNELYAVVHYCGLPPHSDASVGFMSRLLHLPLARSDTPVLASRLPWRAQRPPPPVACGDGDQDYSNTRMFDSFLLTDEVLATHAAGHDGRHEAAQELDTLLLREVERPQLRPYCPCPYTVWDQSRNRRLENVGTRLDYILIDAALLPAVVCRASTVNNTGASFSGEPTDSTRVDFFSEVGGSECRNGIQRAMAGGAYPAAAFDGSGMPALAESARELCCAGLPSTGLFVTPPQFSDHIGVGLVLDLTRLGGGSELAQRPGKLVEDHKSMYRPPVGLQSFFAAAAAKKAAAVVDALPVPLATSTIVRAREASRGCRTDSAEVARKRGAASEGEDSTSTESAVPPKSVRTETTVAAHQTTETEAVDVDEL